MAKYRFEVSPRSYKSLEIVWVHPIQTTGGSRTIEFGEQITEKAKNIRGTVIKLTPINTRYGEPLSKVKLIQFRIMDESREIEILREIRALQDEVIEFSHVLLSERYDQQRAEDTLFNATKKVFNKFKRKWFE